MKKKNMLGADRAQPLISIIMPAYNAEKYIGAAIVSVLSQTYKNWELLILDDCSSDHTVEIAESFTTIDSRIQLLRNPKNIGVAKTRNYGLYISKSKWSALLDSDDVWHQDKLEKQLAIAQSSDADIIYCSYSMIDENAEHLSDFIVPETASYDTCSKRACSVVPPCSCGIQFQNIIIFPRNITMKIMLFGLSCLNPDIKRLQARRFSQIIAL